MIAVDEARHAALAWRIVAWAVGSGRVPVERVALSLRDGLRELREGHAPAARDLEAYGILRSETRESLARDVARRIEEIGARVLARAENEVAEPTSDGVRA